jgi:competence protein ComEC
VSDVAAVALAVAVWLGAIVALPVPRWLGVVAVAVAFVLRRPWVLVAGGALLASGLAVAALAGLSPPSSPVEVRGPVVLVSDPVDAGPALRVDVRVGGRRVEAWARGEVASALRSRLAGEVVELAGRLRAPPEDARARLAVRHVAARLDVREIGAARAGAWAFRAANEVRRVLVAGTASLPADRRALLTGFLIGDDRDVPAPVEADFRASGLSHLLAVSGSNLAFLMAVIAPVLRRFQLRGRLLSSLAVIAFFTVLTRAEPSVLRASAMATIACWAAFSGRPVSRLRVLALAVAALVLIDPMLVRSVGFQLSVGASLGLAVLAAPIAERMPGPRLVAEPLAVTCAAQLGVAPVLLTTFGGMPLVTLLANLVAVPVAAPLTAWGLTAGLLAGVLGGAPAAALQVPTGLMVGWIAGVARVAARAPVGVVGPLDVAVLVVVVTIAAWRLRRFVVPIALATALLVGRPTGGAIADAGVARGAHLWRAGGVVLVLDGGTDAGHVLDEVRTAGIRGVDLVVARSGTKAVAGVIADLRQRVPIRAVVAPPGNRIRDATTVGEPVELRVGRLVVRLAPDGAVLAVDIGETATDGGDAR